MTFAALESRTNAAVMRRLSNARASVVGGSGDFAVIFERAHVETSVGASAIAPLATAADSDITSVQAHVSQITIGSDTFTVRDLQPDGTGLTVMVLEDV